MTKKQEYEQDVMRSLGNIEGKLDGIDTYIKDSKKKDDDQDTRLTKIENRQHWIAGAYAFLISSVYGFFNGGGA